MKIGRKYNISIKKKMEEVNEAFVIVIILLVLIFVAIKLTDSI